MLRTSYAGACIGTLEARDLALDSIWSRRSDCLTLLGTVGWCGLGEGVRDGRNRPADPAHRKRSRSKRLDAEACKP